jgi:hypothetical protein
MGKTGDRKPDLMWIGDETFKTGVVAEEKGELWPDWRVASEATQRGAPAR